MIPHTFGEPGIIHGGYPGQPGPKEMIYLSVGVVPSSLQGQAGRATAATAFRTSTSTKFSGEARGGMGAIPYSLSESYVIFRVYVGSRGLLNAPRPRRPP